MRRAAKPVDLTLEREIQSDCIQLYETLGCIVVVFSQHGRLGSGTRQRPGIADLKVYCPRKRCSWWQEVKSPSGRQSEAQRVFQALVESCEEPYVIGGIEAALEQCRAVGLLGRNEVLAMLADRRRRQVPRQAPIAP